MCRSALEKHLILHWLPLNMDSSSNDDDDKSPMDGKVKTTKNEINETTGLEENPWLKLASTVAVPSSLCHRRL